MSLLVTCLVFLLFATSTFAYLFWRDEQARKAFAKRNVKFVKVINLFYAWLFKTKVELVKDEVIRKEGNVFGFNMLGTPTILIADLEIIQLVMNKEFTNFINRRSFPIPDKIFYNNIGFNRDEHWKRIRTVITPAFSHGKLRRMKPCIDSVCKNLIKHFDECTPVGEMKRLSGAFTMDTIVRIAYGTKIDSLEQMDSPIVLHAKKMFANNITVRNLLTLITVFSVPKLAKLIGLRFMGETFDFFENISMQILKEKRAQYKANKPDQKGISFLELLLEAEAEGKMLEENDKLDQSLLLDANGSKISKYITDDELMAQCVMFFLAGYDTTATLISLSCYNLALNQDKQEILHKHIDNCLEKWSKDNPDTDDPYELASFENLNEFTYLSGVIDETLRIYPPALYTERVAGKDMSLETSDGKTRFNVMKGDILQIPIYSLHHNEDYFPQPEKYEPERFIGPPTFPKTAYIPFGQGPRNCIAKRLAQLEAKIALFHIFRNFKLSTCEKTQIPVQFFNQTNFQTPKKIFLKIEKRI